MKEVEMDALRNVCGLTVGLVLALAAPMQAGQKVAFVTSKTGTGDLSSWVTPLPLDGLVAADFVCQVAAVNAGLDPDHDRTFRAWLSDDLDDAYCRVQGLDGKKADHCDTSLPLPGAGPWVRTDGVPFAGSIDELVAGLVVDPLQVNEHGQLTSATAAWTGTDGTGEAYPETCNGWTADTSGLVGLIGVTDGGFPQWTHLLVTGCQVTNPLLCLETGPGDPLSLPVHGGRRAFLSSASGNGDLHLWPEAHGSGGLVGGDRICQSEASQYGLAFPATFRALLSDSVTDARNRLVNDGPWVRVDGVLIASNKADLTDRALATTLNVLPDGSRTTDLLPNVWTGSSAFATKKVGESCSDWTDGSASSDGNVAFANRSGDDWLDFGSNECDRLARLYCFSDAPGSVLFADGFESGSARLWRWGQP